MRMGAKSENLRQKKRRSPGSWISEHIAMAVPEKLTLFLLVVAWYVGNTGYNIYNKKALNLIHAHWTVAFAQLVVRPRRSLLVALWPIRSAAPDLGPVRGAAPRRCLLLGSGAISARTAGRRVSCCRPPRHSNGEPTFLTTHMGPLNGSSARVGRAGGPSRRHPDQARS